MWLYDIYFLKLKKDLHYFHLVNFFLILKKINGGYYTQGSPLGTVGKSNCALKEDLVGLPNALFNCGRSNDFEHNSYQVKERFLGSPTQP